jgi:HK97 family phage prohead protease
MAYIVVDLDGTLVLEDNQPNQPLIDATNALVMAGETEVIVVSARSIDRLEESRAWLQEYGVAGVEEVYLNDFEGTPFATGLEFKTYKVGKLVEDGADITFAIDNDADVRAAYEALNVKAYTWQEVVAAKTNQDTPAEDAPAAEAPAEDEAPTRADRREFETRGMPVGDYSVVDTEDGQRTVTFYSALFDQPSKGLPFTESIAPGAFKRAIGQAAQGRRIVKLLHNHDEGRMLASTASGRMVLEEDQRGLKVTAQVDPADPDGAKIISLLQREAAAMSASFGFYIPKGGDAWDSEGNRRITEASLVECSLLSGATAAYPSTQGLATVRKVAAQKIGIDADTLMNTFERVKAGQLLSEDDAKVLDTVRQKLGPKPARVIHPSVAEAQLTLNRLNSENQ